MPLSDVAVRLITYLFMALSHVFEERADCYVGADQFLFWDSLDARKRIAPDVYVLFGVPKRPLRSVWRLWEHPAPSFVVEISSPRSRRGDRGKKVRIYQEILRVPEYLIYDEDTREMLLYRLEGGKYVQQSPGEGGLLHSRELDVWFAPDEELGVRVYRSDGTPELWVTELYRALEVSPQHEAGVMQIARMELGQGLKERDEALLEEQKAAAERRRQGLAPEPLRIPGEEAGAEEPDVAEELGALEAKLVRAREQQAVLEAEIERLRQQLGEQGK